MGNKREAEKVSSEPQKQEGRIWVGRPDPVLAQRGFETYIEVVRRELPPELRPRFNPPRDIAHKTRYV